MGLFRGGFDPSGVGWPAPPYPPTGFLQPPRVPHLRDVACLLIRCRRIVIRKRLLPHGRAVRRLAGAVSSSSCVGTRLVTGRPLIETNPLHLVCESLVGHLRGPAETLKHGLYKMACKVLCIHGSRQDAAVFEGRINRLKQRYDLSIGTVLALSWVPPEVRWPGELYCAACLSGTGVTSLRQARHRGAG